jgi:hypothetical protein
LSWVCLEAVSARVWGISGVDVRGGSEGGVQRFGEARQAFLRLIRAHRFLPSVFLIITTEGKHPRDSRGHDKDGRRSWGVERNDP